MEAESSYQGKEKAGEMKQVSDLENQRETTRKIFKVPSHVKNRNLEAYKPNLVSIGPYHHGEPRLQDMEFHKRKAQEKLVEASKVTIDKYKVEIKKVVKTLKESYADLDHAKWDDDKFVDQMILDGCFLIAFFSEPINFFVNYPTDDRIFSQRGHAINYNAVMQDLLLVENQLPYLALEKLLTTSGKNPDVISQWIRPGVEELGFHMLETHMGGLLKFGERSTQYKVVGKLPASELYAFNVQFKKAKSYANMKFNDGTLSLPVLIINEHTTSTYLNMVAQALTQESETTLVFTIYARLMGTLVKTKDDVRLLESHGILINKLSNREAAVEVIQEIARGIITENDRNDEGLSYNSVQEDLETFCQKKNIMLRKTLGLWLSELYEAHFKTPWTGLSLFAAIVLLALTAAQTYYALQSYKYAVLSYKKQ